MLLTELSPYDYVLSNYDVGIELLKKGFFEQALIKFELAEFYLAELACSEDYSKISKKMIISLKEKLGDLNSKFKNYELAELKYGEAFQKDETNISLFVKLQFCNCPKELFYGRVFYTTIRVLSIVIALVIEYILKKAFTIAIKIKNNLYNIKN